MQFTNNVRVTGNLFSGNSASLSGGGLAVLGAGENGTSTVLISGNNFTANTVRQDIRGTPPPPSRARETGVYFTCDSTGFED